MMRRMMNECKHDYIVKDGASEKETYKITICRLCHEVKAVVPRNEKPKEQTVWDLKDLRIARMSAIKSAADTCQGGTVDTIIKVAEIYLNWIYKGDL
jgi:hypothetical protein